MSADDPHAACVAIPQSAFTVTGFQAWMESSEFPEQGRIEFCDGEILVDMSPERVDSHAFVKGEIYRVLAGLVRDRDLGWMCPDGGAFSNEVAGIVTQPDAMFVSFESLRSGKVRGGTPDDTPLGFRGEVDWILEVVSPSSVTKDRKRWVQKYAEARVPEYWLVDARKDEIEFDVYGLTTAGYRIRPAVDGWRTSEVFGAEFRLERTRDRAGGWQYTLLVR